MERRTALQREIGHLETQLSSERVIEELAVVRRGLGGGGEYQLPNVRLGFACTQRWEDMAGDERVRACNGCDRPVFNLSSMTRDEAAAVLATRGLTPCIRFYRRPDGTVMTTDCPTGERRERWRLAVVASSFAAGAALASPSASAQPAPDSTPESAADPSDDAPPPPSPILNQPMMGIPVSTQGWEMGVLISEDRPKRPRLAWSVWGRLGMGVTTSRHPTVLARTLTPPEPESTSIWEAALATEITVGIAKDGDVRLGAWGEVRTSSGPVVGGSLVVEGLPRHPFGIRKTASVVLRGGGNAHVITGAIGIGVVGSSDNSWLHWAGHAVGGRLVASVNRSRDDPRDWSATLGLEIEPIGALHAVLDLARSH